jgi:hypothetical protein
MKIYIYTTHSGNCKFDVQLYFRGPRKEVVDGGVNFEVTPDVRGRDRGG